jgi:ribonuclease-3
MPDPLDELEQILNYKFRDREILLRALRHGSAETAVGEGSYQRLEFYGDAVLGHAIALLLFHQFPQGDQGYLTRMRSHLARAETLSQKSSLIGLDGFVEVGPSEHVSHGRERYTLLEDIYEAIIGAIAIDGGWEAALGFIREQFGDDIEGLDERTLTLANPKTALQEAAQADGLPVPEYRQVGSSGPDHQRLWAFEVVWDGGTVARGEGRTKREAQQQAARRALVRLGIVSQE